MGSFLFQLLCFISAIIFILVGQVTVAQPTSICDICVGANYTSSSQFLRNLNLTMSSLSSSSIIASKKFYNNSYGQSPDRVYGMLLCRGDLTNEACKNCADTATRDIVTQSCPNSKEFITWYDDCMLRYSDKNIFSDMQVLPAFLDWNDKNVTDQERFSQTLSDLKEHLIRKVSSNAFSATRFATGESNTTFYEKIYGLVQCTPDISGSDCFRCLNGTLGYLPSLNLGRPGGRVLKPSCHMRYEVYPFYELNAKAPPVILEPSPFPLPPDDATANTPNGKSSSQRLQ